MIPVDQLYLLLCDNITGKVYDMSKNTSKLFGTRHIDDLKTMDVVPQIDIAKIQTAR